MIKLIATDLDGTLLRRDKTISPYTLQVLQQCRARGIKLVFATARPRRVTVGYCAQIPVDALALHNGAVVYAGEKLLAHHGIDAKERILQAIARDHPQAKLCVEIDDAHYANFDVTAVWDNVTAVASDFTNLPAMPADKIIVLLDQAQDLNRYAQYVPDDCYIQLCEGAFGLIMHRSATKHNAVQALAAHFGISPAEIAAFGDDHNDIGMLRFAGTGVAMANAIDEVKAAADFICGTNDEDGVARWLENALQSDEPIVS